MCTLRSMWQAPLQTHASIVAFVLLKLKLHLNSRSKKCLQIQHPLLLPIKLNRRLLARLKPAPQGLLEAQVAEVARDLAGVGVMLAEVVTARYVIFYLLFIQ